MSIIDRLGYIYKITNKLNGRLYVGQTSRNVMDRFAEHIRANDDYPLHNAIKEFGWTNFSCEVIESVPLNLLDEREKYWIKELNANITGYNISSGGKTNLYNYPHLMVVENNLVFDSKEEASRIISEYTSWSIRMVSNMIKKAIDNKEQFFCYHLTYIYDVDLSPKDKLIDWVKTLNIRYQGIHIHCNELDLDFQTIGQAAKFLYENGYYAGNSKYPIQSLTTSISNCVKYKTDKIITSKGNLSFEKIPGRGTKNLGSINPFLEKKIFCKELNIIFNSESEAAKYFIDNNIWTGIKLKTAKLRISDVIRGVYKDYKGYSFVEVKDHG